MVVPVGGGELVAGETERLNVVVADPAPDTDGSGNSNSGSLEENEALEDSVFEPQRSTAVPILEYNREPNKYGKTDSLPHFLPVSLMHPPSGD